MNSSYTPHNLDELGKKKDGCIQLSVSRILVRQTSMDTV